MAWRKIGLVFDRSKYELDWINSHAMLPTPLVMEDCIRVYYSPRDVNGKSRITYVDLDKDDPAKVLYVHKEPVLSLGKLGACDDSGTLCTCALECDGKIYLYYTAYNIRVTVPYGNAIGLAVSDDGGNSFTRLFDGPVLDRSAYDPYFVISPWVMKFGEGWRMWYAAGTKWITVDGKPESLYQIKTAFSQDAINWCKDDLTCIPTMSEYEANAKPTVVFEDGMYKMWFCYRGSNDFRDGPESYRIGYATSEDGLSWIRSDAECGIQPGPQEWDSKMQAYPSVVSTKSSKYLFYNGNGFGMNGFCCAVWE
ncbi:hypothetical protein [Desulfovibrio oxyclinae]|uniref:hypothetical protein n=1 Tax=Desulfovibrio oxyclinae TaxID=63560 RepID=UPI0012EA6595|nr:hypothetical protein [Desulfovibrio oxyclinae]